VIPDLQWYTRISDAPLDLPLLLTVRGLHGNGNQLVAAKRAPTADPRECLFVDRTGPIGVRVLAWTLAPEAYGLKREMRPGWIADGELGSIREHCPVDVRVRFAEHLSPRDTKNAWTWSVLTVKNGHAESELEAQDDADRSHRDWVNAHARFVRDPDVDALMASLGVAEERK
jgi:hypothetical protein